MTRNALATAALAVLTACTPSDRPAGGPSRDSAGIEIVESASPKPGAGRRVAELPTLDLAGPQAELFGEAMTAARLSDGRIVVADGRPPVLRYFSPSGRWLYDVGSQADGKEFLRSIFQLSVGRGDTVAVYDLAMRRALLIDPNGALAGSLPVADSLLPKGTNGFLPHGLTPDGRYLLQRDEVAVPFTGGAGEIRPDSTSLFWLDRRGTITDSSGRLRAGEIFGFAVNSGKPEPLMVPLARPFSGALRTAIGPTLVWYGEGTRWEFRGLDGKGKVARIIRLTQPAVPLTPALRDSFIARFRARQVGAQGGIVQQQFAEGIGRAPFADTLPAYTALFFGRDSTLWVQHAGLLDGMPGDASLTWTVIDAEGRWEQEITMPPGFRPTAAGREWVLGLWRGPQGAAHVRLYPLVEG